MSIRTLCITVLALSLVVGCGGNEDGSSAAEEMAEGHEGDKPRASEAVREPSLPVKASEVRYGEIDGNALTGYLAEPSNSDSVFSERTLDPSSARLPGLLVIHEWWGLNENIRTATRRLAGEGYRALAIDLYDDSTAETPAEAQRLMKRAASNEVRLLANVRAGDQYLRGESGAPRVGVIGWCFGGGMTFRAVADQPSTFEAAVAYYGSPEALTKDVLPKMTTPILAHFGRRDEVISSDQVENFQERVKGAGASVQIHQYDAGHAFANPSGEQYEPQAAKTAWARTTKFLQAHLDPSAGQ